METTSKTFHDVAKNKDLDSEEWQLEAARDDRAVQILPVRRGLLTLFPLVSMLLQPLRQKKSVI